MTLSNSSATGFPILASARDPADAIFDQVVEAGRGFTHTLGRGQILRIVDLEGNQAVDTLFYSLADPLDRYSAVDTIREQGNVYLGAGTRLLSVHGRHLLSIVADTCGRHDTLGGACAAESNQVRYALEKKYMHNCRDNFLLTGCQCGIGKRDLTANINFFMNVPLTPGGKLTFEDGISAPGRYVELEAQVDVRILISNCPQLNNPCNAYNPTPIQVLIWNAPS
ncbi:MAG TPA: urea amidolyase associated protein UAAP2 [Polyangiaceae bacterium]|nr:urea amidolyase associated protein UAAP2 [Polyangiaceae bacterium]